MGHEDDTVTIPRVCGTCFFFQPQPGQVAANRGVPGDNDVIQGLCFYNPPSAHLVQQMNPLTGQPQSGVTALSPNVASERNACHGWCPDDADPFSDVPEVDPE